MRHGDPMARSIEIYENLYPAMMRIHVHAEVIRRGGPGSGRDQICDQNTPIRADTPLKW